MNPQDIDNLIKLLNEVKEQQTQLTQYVKDLTVNQLKDIIKELKNLPANDIMILQLTYLFQFKDSQIAKQLSINISAVKKRRERAKARLYNRLLERGEIL